MPQRNYPPLKPLLNLPTKIRPFSSFSSSSQLFYPVFLREEEAFFSNQSIIDQGSLPKASFPCDHIRTRDTITWNQVISGLGRYGCSSEALQLYREMTHRGLNGSSSTFSSLLSICASNGALIEGMELHSKTVILGFESNSYVGSSLITLYAQCGRFEEARTLLELLEERSLASFNGVLKGYSEWGFGLELKELFFEMREGGIEANSVSFSYLIQGFGRAGLLCHGRELHCHMIKLGLATSNIFVMNSLVDMYCSCGVLSEALHLFKLIPAMDVLSWSSIVSVFAEHGDIVPSIKYLYEMLWWGKRPSLSTFPKLLNQCSSLKLFLKGKQIHGLLLKLGLNGSDYVRSSLIDMYGNSRDIESSLNVFDEIHDRNLVSWNSVICALSECGFALEAIRAFKTMVLENIRPDEISLSKILKACASMASLNMNEQFHTQVIKNGFESNLVVSTSLIDSYAKFGEIELAHLIFYQIQAPTTTSLTAFISACARNGFERESLKLFDLMLVKGLKPDSVTFLSLLSGCSHGGLIEEGKRIFETMEKNHGIIPDIRHYSCMVDLLGRGGLLNEAEELLKASPFGVNSTMVSSLLRSCRIHGNLKMGRRVAEALMELEPELAASYLQALNMFSETESFTDSLEIREMMKEKKFEREPGYSLYIM
ncbi:pentatricopeptide repeat-containing protein At3g13880-like [Amborella trichopoda]|uniref:Pentacotripeptide-repeat region of PRORP domain-containing protein n=1 Tax=Amborella trichopoda TaxID=13333 RepID=W1NVU6_AMBTC|nr:pentatricopeptide repeat-containing protein At3g13880-like [Amborella trichopoda]ERM99722.1 hypothetical protein AMTR_s00099p00097640 [Amborella trichopoda]|eukprot:XP_020519041.1 pentatricopeptide repeat-containing protein At3g13880-like [Amborella trichopoda]